MSAEQGTVLSILNLLGNEGASDGEVINTVSALRRLIKGDGTFVENLRGVLEIKNSKFGEYKSVSAWQDQIDEIATKLAAAEAAHGDTEKTNSDLLDKITKLEANVAFLETALAEARGTEQVVYTLKDLREAVFKRTKNDYGWQVALQNASVNSSYGPITNADIMKWRKDDIVPAAVIKAVIHMDFQPRRGKKNTHWTKSELEFLSNLIFRNDGQKIPNYILIAHQCSVEFGREITENAIKGQTDRLRKKRRKVVPVNSFKKAA